MADFAGCVFGSGRNDGIFARLVVNWTAGAVVCLIGSTGLDEKFAIFVFTAGALCFCVGNGGESGISS
jgi:hypothetical protein